MRPVRLFGHGLAPAETRSAADAQAWEPIHRFDDADELSRPKHSALHREPRGEVDHPKSPIRSPEGRLEDVRVLEVALQAALAGCRPDDELAAIAVVEKRREHRLGVKSGKTTPHHCPPSLD